MPIAIGIALFWLAFSLLAYLAPRALLTTLLPIFLLAIVLAALPRAVKVVDCGANAASTASFFRCVKSLEKP